MLLRVFVLVLLVIMVSCEHEVTVHTPDLPDTADKLAEGAEKSADAFDPLDARGSREAIAEKETENRQLRERNRELQSQPNTLPPPPPPIGPRFVIELYDSPQDNMPGYTVELFPGTTMNLNNQRDVGGRHWADRAAKVVIRKGPTYQAGDQVVFLDACNGNTSEIRIGPGTYNLNNQRDASGRGWADRAACLECSCP